MSDPSSTQRAAQVLEEAQPQVAAFARASHAADGRGTILVRVPDLTPVSAPTLVATEMVYHTLSDVRRSTADVRGSARVDADVLLRMIETYDPETQAVVTVDFENAPPITVKMKLERPSLVAAPATEASQYFEQERAFREAHATCVPDRLEYTVWLPHGRTEASVTVKCACGATTTIPCTADLARTTLVAFRMNGMPVTELNGPEGIH